MFPPKPELDFGGVAAAALAACPGLLREWFPSGKVRGRKFFIGSLKGEAGESLAVLLDHGGWRDAATQDHGKDLIALYAAAHGVDQGAACEAVAAQLGQDATRPSISGIAAPKPAQPKWGAVLPVPAGASAPPARHHVFGDPEHVARVVDQSGALLHLIMRFAATDARRKMVQPLTFGTLDGRAGWHWKAPPEPRPLYGLPLRDGLPVLVVEGEMKRDAAARLLPTWDVVSWPNGADGIPRADWRPLERRTVVIWPDRDEAGERAAAAVVQALSAIAAGIQIVTPPEGPQDGWDLADAEREGWTREQVTDCLLAARGAFAETVDPAFDMGPGMMGPDGPGAEPPPQEEPKPHPDAGALLARLEAAMKRSAKLKARWEGSTEGLVNPRPKAVDMSMMSMLRKKAFTLEETIALLSRWPHASEESKKGGAPYWTKLWDLLRPVEDVSETRRNRPLIQLAKGKIAALTDQAEDALLSADLGLYQRGDAIVRPGIVRVSAADAETTEAQQAVPMGEKAVVEAMDTAAAWEKWDQRADAYVVTDAPDHIAKTYMQRVGRWRLPVLTGFINAPTLRADGSILDVAGYDKRSGLIFDPRGVTFPRIPVKPNWTAAAEAIVVLQELLTEFPFVSKAHKSVALAAMLTALVRRSLETAPLIAFSANTPGTGKTYAANLAAILATGHKAPAMTFAPDEEESEKRLSAMLLQADPVILIDNVMHPLGGQLLNAMLTDREVRGRILGKSSMPKMISNALVMATGNNLVLHADLVRRSLLCTMDADMEKPETRAFETDPVAMLLKDRPRFVVAGLTIIRAFLAKGAPQQATPIGSYGDWCRMVRDPLIWLGYADPVSTMDEVRGNDPQLSDLGEVLGHWFQVIGTDTVTARQVMDRASSKQTGAFGKEEFRYPEFHEAMLKVAGKGGAINTRSLGWWLRGNVGRIVAGRRVVKAADGDDMAKWRVEKA